MNGRNRRTLSALDRIAAGAIFVTALAIAAVSALAAEAPTSIVAHIAPTTIAAARHLSESDRGAPAVRAPSTAREGR